MRSIILFLFATLLTFAPLTASAAAAVFNVRDFGAVGDATTKDTAAFQRALDTCAVSGGGEVLVPSGRYLIGSIQMGTRTTLRFASADSILLGSPDADDYPMVDVRWEGRWQPGRGDSIEVFVNGVRQNTATKLPVVAGAIALQMEGSPIEFRNLWLEEL